MIIQNSHKIRIKNQELRIKTSFFLNKKLVFSFLFSLFSFLINAQDSIVPQSSITEKVNLKFQQFFFRALSEKAIGNHQKAIQNLEEANLLIPNEKAVLFEFSKNYLLSNKTNEAIEYGNLALEKDPDNLWLLEHMVKVYKWNRDYEKAIEIQKKIAEKHPKKKQQLVFLQLQNKDYTAAKRTLKELEKAKLLTARLRSIKTNLERKKNKNTPKKITATIKKTNLKDLFKKEKSFSSLKKLLEKLDAEKSADLLTYSQKGLEIFPAQPFVYLMNGKALNSKKEYKKALESLQNGIDFVIDNRKMELQFYIEFANAYSGIGNIKEANKYKNKALKLK